MGWAKKKSPRTAYAYFAYLRVARTFGLLEKWRGRAKAPVFLSGFGALDVQTSMRGLRRLLFGSLFLGLLAPPGLSSAGCHCGTGTKCESRCSCDSSERKHQHQECGAPRTTSEPTPVEPSRNAGGPVAEECAPHCKCQVSSVPSSSTTPKMDAAFRIQRPLPAILPPHDYASARSAGDLRGTVEHPPSRASPLRPARNQPLLC